MPALSIKIKGKTFRFRNVFLLVALLLISGLSGKLILGSPTLVRAADQSTNTAPEPGIPPLPHVQQISAQGGNTTCTLLEDGSVKCWGENSFGQLGNGANDNSNVPVPVRGLGDASAVVAGYSHSCALVEGYVECWGKNNAGQLGDGTTTNRTTPVKTNGMGDIVALSIGDAHTCALGEEGDVQCWGARWGGQPGGVTPSPVVGLADRVVSIADGLQHTCAALKNGDVQCWGRNNNGQLGNGTTHESATPVTVIGIDNAQSVFAGQTHTCALLNDGKTKCWGRDAEGQLGNGIAVISSTVPVDVVGIDRKVHWLGLGGEHTCALIESIEGIVKCWGDDRSGQLGIFLPPPSYSATPLNVPNLLGRVKQVVGGSAHTCALLKEGIVQCWGANNSGQLGNGRNDNSIVPVIVIEPDAQSEGTPTETEEPTKIEEPTEVKTPTPTFTVLPSITSTPTKLPSATATPKPTKTETPTPTARPSATSTATPRPTRTTAPTRIPIPTVPETTLSVDSITPNHGVNTGRTNVTIHGANFGATPQVRLGDHLLTEVVFVDATQLLAVIPADLPPATYNLIVTNPDGNSAKLPQAFTVEPATVSVLKVQPGRGSANVPNDVTIIGFNFMNGAQASLNTTPPVQFTTTYINSLHLLATIPAGLTPGLYDLTITNPGGANATLPKAYQVLATINDDLTSSEENLWADPQPLRAQTATTVGLVVHRQGGKNLIAGVKVRFTVEDQTHATTALGDGEIIEPLAPRSDASTQGVNWTPAAAGNYTVTAVIDPDNQITEGDETNNTVHHTFAVLPADLDQLAPHVDKLTINQGATDTTVPTVTLALTATDPTEPPPSSGVNTALFIEYIYSQSADQWLPVQTSGWQLYATAHNNYPWQLLPRAGLHYVKGWAADQAGNISTYPFRALTNYIPLVDHVEQNQARVYRYALEAGQRLQVKVEPLHGDPDLYVWAPDYASGGRPPYVSNLEGEGTVDQINFVAPLKGVYQIEIYGYSAADYRLTVTISAGSNVEAAAQTGGVTANKPVYTQPLIALDSAPSDRQSLPAAPNIPTGIPATTSSAIYLPLVSR